MCNERMMVSWVVPCNLGRLGSWVLGPASGSDLHVKKQIGFFRQVAPATWGEWEHGGLTLRVTPM